MFLRKVIFFIFIAIFIFYSFFVSRGIIFPPKLSIYSPKNFSHINETVVKISGKTDSKLVVWVDGKHIQSDEQGLFDGSLFLFPGYNEIGISVKNHFGKETKKTIKLLAE